MKKSLSAVLALALTMGALTACGGSGSTADTTTAANDGAEASEAAGTVETHRCVCTVQGSG